MKKMTNSTTQSIHASMIAVFGCGVLFIGGSNTGKSELCLSLLDRGHQLISDDMVRLENRDTVLWGLLPNHATRQLAIRDIGLIDVGSHFGKKSLLTEHRIHVVIQLIKSAPQIDPTQIKPKQYHAIGCMVPQFSLSCSQNRPLALLVETLAKVHFAS